MTIYSGFSQWKWFISIALLVYQRVFAGKSHGFRLRFSRINQSNEHTDQATRGLNRRCVDREDTSPDSRLMGKVTADPITDLLIQYGSHLKQLIDLGKSEDEVETIGFDHSKGNQFWPFSRNALRMFQGSLWVGQSGSTGLYRFGMKIHTWIERLFIFSNNIWLWINTYKYHF